MNKQRQTTETDNNCFGNAFPMNMQLCIGIKLANTFLFFCFFYQYAALDGSEIYKKTTLDQLVNEYATLDVSGFQGGASVK